jgi:hypothetical protein
MNLAHQIIGEGKMPNFEKLFSFLLRESLSDEPMLLACNIEFWPEEDYI